MEWERSKAERLEAELRILRAAMTAIESREERRRVRQRPELYRAAPETVELRSAVRDKIADAEDELLALVECYVETWPPKEKRPPG